MEKNMIPTHNEKLTGQITSSTKITQCFIAQGNYLNTVKLDFATYRRKNNCFITVTIVDLQGNLIYSISRKCKNFIDNQYETFDVRKAIYADKKYKLILTSDGDAKNAVTAKYGKTDNNQTFTINDKIMQGFSLSMQINFKTQNEQEDNTIPKEDETIEESEKTQEKKVETGFVDIILNAGNSKINEQFKQIESQSYKNINIILRGNKDSDYVYNNRTIQVVKSSLSMQNIVNTHCKGKYVIEMTTGVFKNDDSLQTLVSSLTNEFDMVICSGEFNNKKVNFIWDKSPTDIIMFKKDFLFSLPNNDEDIIKNAYLCGGTFAKIETPIITLTAPHRKSIRLKGIPQNINQKEIAIYTCITGDYEKFIVPTNIPDNADFFCIIDGLHDVDDVTNNVNFIKTDANVINRFGKHKAARMYKILGHRFFCKYKYNIWIDGNMKINTDTINNLVDRLNKDSMILFKHPLNNCLYKEARKCIQLQKDDKTIINNQINKYKKNKYPKNKGMTETGVMLRETTNLPTMKLMESWWKEIKQHSHRDQISLHYCIHKNKYRKLKILSSASRSTYVTKTTVHR